MALPDGEKAGNKRLQEILRNKNIGFEYINLTEDKGSTSYAVPSQEQIRILGSKEDIQGFKDFVQGDTTITDITFSTDELTQANDLVNQCKIGGSSSQIKANKSSESIKPVTLKTQNLKINPIKND
jgi:hypothetical protein